MNPGFPYYLNYVIYDITTFPIFLYILLALHSTLLDMLDLAIAVPTLIGSVLSMFAAGFIFLYYIVLPSQKHFRHTLILNLAFAGKLILSTKASPSLKNYHRLLQCPQQQHFWNLRFPAWINTSRHSMLHERLDWAMDRPGMVH